MELLLAIQIAKAAIDAAQEGVPLIEKVIALLSASDDADAKTALADLKAAYVSTGSEADAALAARISAA